MHTDNKPEKNEHLALAASNQDFPPIALRNSQPDDPLKQWRERETFALRWSMPRLQKTFRLRRSAENCRERKIKINSDSSSRYKDRKE